MTSSVCEFCGRPFPTRDFSLVGHGPMLITLPCDCPEAKAALEREERERERMERIEAFARVWERAGIPVMFQHVDADFTGVAPILEGRSLYIHGENGRGKTHGACRVAKAYLVRNTRRVMNKVMCAKTARFVTAQEMFARLRQSWDRWDETEEDVFQRWSGVDLLVLDDLGKGVPSEWAAENVFRLIDSRWSNGRPMVITSQYSMDQLAERYEKASDETMSAIVSRLQGWCEVKAAGGDDLRLSHHTA